MEDDVTAAEPDQRATAPETAVPAGIGQPEEGDRWVFMIDPAWQAREQSEDPPVEAVVGGWYVGEDGVTGLFRPNPAYEPSQPDFPTDPVDAVLQLLVRGEAEAEELFGTLHDIMFGVALDSDGKAVVAPAPDDRPSLLVATAPAHRARVQAYDWADVTVMELAETLPEEGMDVLVNPGAPASIRLLATVVKDAARGAEDAGAADGGTWTG